MVKPFLQKYTTVIMVREKGRKYSVQNNKKKIIKFKRKYKITKKNRNTSIYHSSAIILWNVEIDTDTLNFWLNVL